MRTHDNPMDLAILTILKHGRSPRRISKAIEQEIEKGPKSNDATEIGSHILKWNVAQAFAEDMTLDKARGTINRLKRATHHKNR